jgi:hypothetical protein
MVVVYATKIVRRSNIHTIFYDSMKRKPKLVKADNRTKQKIFARMGSTRGYLTIGNTTIKINLAEMKRIHIVSDKQ